MVFDGNRHKTKKQMVLDLLSAGQPQRFAAIRSIAGSFIPIQELLDEGKIVKVAKGLYSLAGAHENWNSLATIGFRYPEAVICLDTAASYHGLTTQNPHEVFAAFLYGSSSIPRSEELSVRAFRWRRTALEVGVETVEIAGIPVKMTSPARTVVDLIRFMSRRAGDEEAVEALRAYVDSGGDMKSLIKISRLLHCEKTVRPYTTVISGLRSLP